MFQETTEVKECSHNFNVDITESNLCGQIILKAFLVMSSLSEEEIGSRALDSKP